MLIVKLALVENDVVYTDTDPGYKSVEYCMRCSAPRSSAPCSQRRIVVLHKTGFGDFFAGIRKVETIRAGFWVEI